MSATPDDDAAVSQMSARLALAAFLRGDQEMAERIVALDRLAGGRGVAEESTIASWLLPSIGLPATIPGRGIQMLVAMATYGLLLTRLTVERPDGLGVRLVVANEVRLGGGDGVPVAATLLRETFPFIRVFPGHTIAVHLMNLTDREVVPGNVVLTGWREEGPR